MIYLVQYRAEGMNEKWKTDERHENLVDAIEYATSEAKVMSSTEHRVKIRHGRVLMKIKALGVYA